MSFDGYAFDIYPYNDPNGTRLVRLTPAKAVQLAFRLPEQGFGMADGQIIIHSAHADATAANFHKHNLVKVVAIQGETETKVGGFFLEEGDFAALSSKEEGGRILSFRGPNTVYYLERAILREEPFSENPAAGTTRGSFDVDGMWTWSEPTVGLTAVPGAVMTRALEEGFYQPGPSGTSADAPLADATWDFSRSQDSTGNAWPAQENNWQVRWGTSILDLLLLMLRAGLHWRSGPDLDFSAYGTDPAVDRTSTTFAADKVRFAAGENIVTEVNRDITASVERTALLVTGSENTTAYVTGGTGDVTWIGHVDAASSDATATLTSIGEANLDAREVQVEAAFPLRHIVSDDELNGGYIPFIHYVPGDLVTLHTGTGDHDFNDFAIPVAAVRILHDSAGNWFGMPELGAQSISAESKAFEERVNRIIHQPGGHSHPIPLCQPASDPGDASVSAGDYLSNTTPNTIPIPTGTVNALLLVQIKGSDAGSAFSATYEGSAMTAVPGSLVTQSSVIPGQADHVRTQWFYAPIADNTSGVQRDDDVTFVGSYWGWLLVEEADSSDPIGAVATAQGTSTTPAVTVSAGAGGIVVAGFGASGGANTADPTMDAPGTLQWSFNGAGHSSNNQDFGAGYGDTSASFVIDSSVPWVASAIWINGIGGTSGDRHASLVGDGVRASRCGHGHRYHSTSTPTVGDDGAAGFEVGDAWAQLDDLETPTEIVSEWILADASDGAAVWLERPGGADDQTAAEVPFTPAGTIAATDVQAAIEEVASESVQESAFTASGDTLRGTGAGTFEAVKNNLAASAAPTVNDDSGDGYSIGSSWLDTTNDKEYVALDVTLGAAVWKERTNAVGGDSGIAVEEDGVEEGTGIDRLDFTGDITVSVSGTQATINVSSGGGSDDPFGFGFAFTQDPVFAHTNTSVGTNVGRYMRLIGGGAVTKIGMWVTGSTANISIAHYASSGSGRSAKPGTRTATTGAIACPAAGYAEVNLSTTLVGGQWLGISASGASTFRGAPELGAPNALGAGRAYGVGSQHPLPDPAGVTGGATDSTPGHSITLVGVA